MNLSPGVRIAVLSSCGAAVVFLLRVLIALLSEERRARSQGNQQRVQLVPVERRRERLTVIDAETLKSHFALRAGKHWMLAAAIALGVWNAQLQIWR